MPVKNRKKIYLAIAVLSLVSMILFLRSSYLSGVIYKYVSVAIAERTGLVMDVRRLYVNPIPLYLGAEHLELRSKSGEHLASVEKLKAYVSIVKVLAGSFSLERILLEHPVLDITKDSFLMDGRTTSRASIPLPDSNRNMSLIIRDGSFSYKGTASESPIMISGFDMEALINEDVSASFAIDNFRYDIPHPQWPVIEAAFKGRFNYRDSRLDVLDLVASMDGSTLSVSGGIGNIASPQMGGELDIVLDLMVSSLKTPFGLRMNSDGEISSTGSISLGPGLDRTSLDLSIDGDFHLETLLEALRTSSKIRDFYTGRIECSGYLRGPLTNMNGLADAVISDSVIHEIKIDRADAVVKYDGGRLSIVDADTSLYNGSADVNVSFSVLHHEPFDLSVIFRGVDSGPLFDRIHIGNIGLPRGKLVGELRSDGMHFSPSGWARFRGGRRDDTPLGRINYLGGSFYSHDHLLMLHGFNLMSGLSQASFDGSIDMLSGQIAFEGVASTRNISDVLAPYDYGIRSSASVEAKVSGTTSDPVVLVRASLDDFWYQSYPVGSVSAEFDYRKEKLAIKDLKSRSGDSVHDVRGAILFPGAEYLFDLRGASFDLVAHASDADLGGLFSLFNIPAEIGGTFDASLTVGGAAKALDVEGRSHIRNAALWGRELGGGPVEYAFKKDMLTITNAVLAGDRSRIVLSGSIDTAGEYDVALDAADIWFSWVFPGVKHSDFRSKVSVRGSGRLNSPSLSLEAELDSATIMNVPAGHGRIAASLEGDDASVSMELLDGKMSAVGKAYLLDDAPWEMDIVLGYDRYDHLFRATSPSVPEDLVLAMQGAIRMHGDRSHIYADTDLDRVNLTLYAMAFANDGPVQLVLSDKRVYFRNTKLLGAHSSIDINGVIDVGREFDVAVKADASLLSFSGYFDAISYLKGQSSLDLRINGPWNSPSIIGGASVSDAAMGLKGMPQRITAIGGSVIFGEDRALIEKFSAKLGGGDIEMAGTVDFEGFRVVDINVKAIMRDISTRLSPHFNAAFDGHAYLTGNHDRQDINGEVNIKGANYSERIEWKKWLFSGRAETPKGLSAWKDRMFLNLRIYGSDGIRVDNNFARAPVNADIFLRGTLAAPIVIGRVEAMGGKVFFRNSEFKIIRATSDFSEADLGRPTIGVAAQTTIKGYEIWLNMNGRIDQMELDFSSEPPLDENDILELLTYGDLGSGRGAFESGLGTAEATYLLTGEIQDLMEERLTMFVGLDRLQIDPYLSRSTGSITPRITVAKKLMGERLYVTYASSLDAASEQEIKLEYLLSDNISLVGGQDYTGSVGGDLKFRFRFE